VSGVESGGGGTGSWRAVDLAIEALQGQAGPQGEAWGALAAAWAARGDFGRAIGCQQRALWESPPARHTAMAHRLALYLLHRQYRLPAQNVGDGIMSANF